MRFRFAGNSVGFKFHQTKRTGKSSDAQGITKSFQFEPIWTDITPNYDPSGRASELDILQSVDIDVSRFCMRLEFVSGTESEAYEEYASARKALGLPKVDFAPCKTVLSVYKSDIFVTSFIPQPDYSMVLAACEDFASWPNPKAFHGDGILRLMNGNLHAALNPPEFLEFWKGNLPLQSADAIELSFFQNNDVPSRPTLESKQSYYRTQV